MAAARSVPLRAMPSPTVDHDPRITFLSAAEIRRRFVEFFEERGHTHVPSAGLVPAGDQTLLFTNSGMVQFKEVLTGSETRSYTRAVDYQRVPAGRRQAQRLRGGRPVAATPHVLRDARQLELRRLLQARGHPLRLGLPDARPRDPGRSPGRRRPTRTTRSPGRSGATRSASRPSAWRAWGDVDNGDDHNFWRMADTGPCGPCSEIHFDRGAHLSEGPECIPDHSENCPRWLEIWNLVFMEFDQRPDGRRAAAVHERRHRDGPRADGERRSSRSRPNYDTDLFTPIHARMRDLLGHDPEAFEAERFSYQVIADHARAVTFLIADGVLPSNEGRGYVLRRILRRAVRHGRLLGRREPFLAETAEVVIEVMGEAYPHLVERRRRDPRASSSARRRQFGRTLDAGTRLLEEALAALATRRAGHRPPARGPARRRAEAPRRRRVQAPRHVRVPDRPDDRARRRVRRRRRPRGVRRGARRAAAALALGQEGRAREARRARRRSTRRSRAAPGDTTFLGYETTTARGAGRRDPARRHRVRGADRPRRGRGHPRPDAVLRRGRRPDRRSRRAARAGRRERPRSRSRTRRSRWPG